MARHLTRFYALEKGDVEYQHLGDIVGFIPNISTLSIINVNGKGAYRINGMRTDIDLQDYFVIQSILMKAE